VIRRAWRTIIGFVRSPGLATWLLAVVGAWSALATIVPQGAATDPVVAAWASANPLVESVVSVVGLHQAFTSLVFTVCALGLGLSTALCAWQRTRVAFGKARTLRQAAVADERALSEGHRLEIDCDPALSGPEVLSVASATLERLGIRTKRRGDLLASVSSSWSVWGSPVFHWALLVLIVAMVTGNLTRSEGQTGVAVGQTRPDAAASYGLLHVGPLHDWATVHRSIRVDALDPAYVTGGIDRGPTPTVTVLDGSGNVVKTQLVYPNMTLKTGSLTIYPVTFGLSAVFTLVSASGAESGRTFQLVDFSDETSDGTIPVGPLIVRDRSGSVLLQIDVTVPLDRTFGGFAERMPTNPAARVVVTSPDGTALDRILSPGGSMALPSGDTLWLDGVGYYARLQVVDDWSIPLLYVGLIVAMVGLTVAVVTRQQIVLAGVVEGPEGVKLAMTVHLWRNASSSRGEIESELTRALGGVQEGSTT
jgi:cytochrome c biogenesis protein ResB